METGSMLPNGLCCSCIKDLTAALPFIKLCKDSSTTWLKITDSLNIHYEPKRRNVVLVIQNGNVENVIDHGYRKDTIPTETRFKKFVKRVNRKQYEQRKPPGPLKCDECGKKFHQIYKLNKHILAVMKRMCRHCHKIFHITEFPNHLKVHNGTTFSCPKCYKTFEDEILYSRHKDLCKRRAYSCIHCHRTFTSDSRLMYHLPLHKARVCRKCDKVLTNSSCYNFHLANCSKERHDSRPSKFICDYCSRQYRNRAGLKAHIQTSHTLGKTYQCEKCGKKFSNRFHLEEHENTHNKVEDRFACGVCGAKYSTRRGYQKHLTGKGHIGKFPDSRKMDH